MPAMSKVRVKFIDTPTMEELESKSYKNERIDLSKMIMDISDELDDRIKKYNRMAHYEQPKYILLEECFREFIESPMYQTPIDEFIYKTDDGRVFLLNQRLLYVPGESLAEQLTPKKRWMVV